MLKVWKWQTYCTKWQKL